MPCKAIPAGAVAAVGKPDDAVLVTRARDGNREAFGRLVERHAARVFQVCLRVTNDAALADDAVQDAFITAHARLASFRGEAAFTTWLHRIAVNAALQLIRRQQKFRENSGDAAELQVDAAADPAPSIERQTDGLLSGRRLADAMQLLTELERQAFMLRHFEEMSIKEICLALELKDSACKQAIFRAVQKMRSALQDLARPGGASCSQ